MGIKVDPSATDARSVQLIARRGRRSTPFDMPLSKARPPPRPSVTSSFSDIANKSEARKDKFRLKSDEDEENTYGRNRQHERQRTTSVIPGKSDTDTNTENQNYQNENQNEDEDEDESGAIDTVAPTSASTGGRFMRPDFLIQGLLARAKNRVRERSGRGEKGDENVSQDFATCILLSLTRHSLSTYLLLAVLYRHDYMVLPIKGASERHGDIRPLHSHPLLATLSVSEELTPGSIRDEITSSL